MHKRLALVASLHLLAVSTCLAAPHDTVSIAEEVASVSDRIHHLEIKPHPDELEGQVAKLLGLSDGSDIAIEVVSYGGPNEGIGLYFLTLNGRSEIVLVRKDFKIERGLYWVVKGGDIFPKTVLNVRQEVLLVDATDTVEGFTGAQFTQAGKDTLDYFYDHLPAVKNK